MKKKFILLTFISLLASCSYFIKNFSNDSFDVLNMESQKLSIAFSHNINGETHPCGCRHFPLGGLPQLAGVLHELKKDSDVLYVDTGDMLFPTMVVPDAVKNELEFKARSLAQGMSKMGLKYFVPGDQDFALGVKFLREIAESSKFDFLISNLKDPKLLKHIEYAIIKNGPHKIFMVGLIHPETMRPQNAHHFKNIEESFTNILDKLKNKGLDQDNPFHRVMVLSHSGMRNDRKLARKFPRIDWIIGAHSQSFTKFPSKEDNTKIVQVLSRNHYVGHVKIDFKKDRLADTFDIIEVRDEWRTKINPNPFEEFISSHKKNISKIQEKEQERIRSTFSSHERIQTSGSCLDCHDKQVSFYQGTAHSLAYITLLNAGEEKNLQCVKCHSVGLSQKNGFSKFSDMIQFHENAYKLSANKRKGKTSSKIKTLEMKQLERLEKDYWKEVKNSFKHISSVRDLKQKSLKKESVKWFNLDEKFQLTRNFANVQCLNCHSLPVDHPYNGENTTKTANLNKLDKIKGKCLTCHDSDQSPLWYKVKKNGLPGKLDESKFTKKLKQVACPAME